jgi:hypothetical protein
MELKQYLEDRERKSPRNDINGWVDKLNDAVSARKEWDKEFETCSKIRANNIPIDWENSDLSDFTDKPYKDNWVIKANNWKESYLLAADIIVQLRSRAGADEDDPNREYLEMEVNYTMDEFDMVAATGDVISDWIWYGYGVSYLNWNTMRAGKKWKSGTPEFQYIPCQAYWVDSAANQAGWKNRRWEFAKFQIDVEDAKELFPDYADDIFEENGNVTRGDAVNRKEIFDLWLCQYKRTVRLKVVDVSYTLSGKEFNEQVYYKDVEEYLAGVPEGKELPDNIYLSEPYTIEKDCWFQFFFSYDLNKQMSDIDYIGSTDYFQILWSLRAGSTNIYPTSWTMLSANPLDIATFSMTLLAAQAVKNGNPMPIVQQGAIKDMDDFIDNRNSLDYVAMIDADWAMQHPGEKPITFAEGRIDANLAVLFQNLTKDLIKSNLGAVDSARGVSDYSGQSGVQTAQLQSAAAIYTKHDELSYKAYMKQICELLLQFIGEFRTYEHSLPGIGEDGMSETVKINEGNIPTWDWTEYYCVPMVENNPEAIRQLRRQEAIQLRQGQSISNLDMLKMLEYPNAERLEQNRINENEMLKVANFLAANPEILNAIMSGTGEVEEEKSSEKEK